MYQTFVKHEFLLLTSKRLLINLRPQNLLEPQMLNSPKIQEAMVVSNHLSKRNFMQYFIVLNQQLISLSNEFNNC